MKTKRKWIDLTYSSPTSLRAEDIPYDSTMSIRDAIVGLSITGVQGPSGDAGATGISSGPIGATGIEGVTGLGDLQPGVTGLQGIPGPVGAQGIIGQTGIRGLTGFQGVTGFVVPGAMPSAYITMGAVPADAVSSTFVDIPNLSTTITLNSAAQIFSTMSFQAESLGAGSYPTGSFRIVLTPGPSGPDSSGNELEKYFLPDDVSMGTVTHRDSGIFPAASYTVKGQFRRVSGQQKIHVNDAQLYAHALVGGKGDVGPAGATGVFLIGFTGLQGILGSTGLYGPTGLQGGGETGIQGQTGMGIQGATGIEGVTGLQGFQGATGTPALISPPSSFIFFDSTSQLYNNTTSFIDIPGLSTLFTVDTSGAYAYSSMTIEADSTSSPLGSGYVEASMRIVIDDQTSLEYQRYVQNDFDLNSNTIEYRSPPLSDGTHIVKGQIQITDTTGDNKYFRVHKAQLFVQALEGSAGPIGLQGPRGYAGATGILGVTGLVGITGIQGIVGQTGIQGIGLTGLQGSIGSTGLIGPTGITGFTGIAGLGLTGLKGPTGICGQTGISGNIGNLGTTGISGNTGILGITGFYGQTGIQGLTGIYGKTGILGSTGIQGLTGIFGQTGFQGVTGVFGYTGIIGITGFYGQTGIQGLTGIYGKTGISGTTGIQGIIGNTGLQGVTGFVGPTGVQGNSTQILFNPISRYQVVDTPGAEVWVTSSSAVYHGLNWSRTGTAMNIYRDAHGHASGDRVIIRNTNLDFQTTIIDSTTSNSFAVTISNTDGTAGSLGAYSLGFVYAHDGIPSSAGVFSAPSGDHSDCQLLSARIRTGNRTGSTYALQVPASAVNGAGSDTGLSDCYIPDFNVHMDSDTLSAVAATMITNVGGSYSTFEFGNLGSGSLSRMIIVHY